MTTRRRGFATLMLVYLLLTGVACAPRLQPSGGETVTPMTIAGPTYHWQAGDGRVLPLRRWMPEGEAPNAVILAIHGFNDYSNAFTEAAEWWAARGIATYAPDQRGFGRAPFTGLWPGEDRIADDVIELSAVIRRWYHPDVPLYWLGESMGGAVALHALDRSAVADRPAAMVLTAPAVWGRATMPVHYRMALWLTSYTIPWKTFTGSGLKIQASDNIEMLRRLSRDPLFIKATRVDAIHGLVNLMDRAAEVQPTGLPVLLLYGVKDEVIPKKPVEAYVKALRAVPGIDLRIGIYTQGWHMLLRDLQAETVWRDIASWIADPRAPLVSRSERDTLPLFREDEKTDRD